LERLALTEGVVVRPRGLMGTSALGTRSFTTNTKCPM
jgi:hypothetical protein